MPSGVYERPSAIARLAALVTLADPDDCWLWQGDLSDGGYGRFWFVDRNVQAHRWAYEQMIGPIPDGLTLDHLCRTRRCANPFHTEPCTSQENQRRGTAWEWNRRKTRCPRGHAYDEANTYRRPNDNRRLCRACNREQNRANYHRRKGQVA